MIPRESGLIPPPPPPLLPPPNRTGNMNPNVGTGGGPALPGQTAALPKKPAAPPPPVVNTYTGYSAVAGPTGTYALQPPMTQDSFVNGDTQYLAASDESNRLKAAFEASQLRQRNMLDQNVVEQTDGLNRQGAVDQHNQLEDFAGRGVLYSGRYGDDLAQLKDAYARRLTALNESKANSIQNMQDAKNDFYGSQQAQLDAAKNAAIQRYIQQFMSGGAA